MSAVCEFLNIILSSGAQRLSGTQAQGCEKERVALPLCMWRQQESLFTVIHSCSLLAGPDSAGTLGRGKDRLSVAVAICCWFSIFFFFFKHDCLSLEIIYCRLL